MHRTLVAGFVALAACGGRTDDGSLTRLAREVPATARVVITVDGARVRGSWLASSARALRALLPAERGCVVEVALAANRAIVAQLEVGTLVVIATKTPSVECRALSNVRPGVWLATLDGAAAPAANDPRLSDRPDFAALRGQLAAPIAGVAPDGDLETGVTLASAAITPASAQLVLELETPARAEAVERWLREQLADAATKLGTASALIAPTTIQRDGAIVTARLATDPAAAERDGPIVIVAAIARVAARQGTPVAPAPSCRVTTWPVTCTDGTRFELKPELRSTVEAAVRAATPTARVAGGKPAGVRLGTIADDSVLAALGLRTGDAVIAIDNRKLDSREAIDELAGRLPRARELELTIERGTTTFELSYVVK
jgi:hypothetical protein